MKIVVADTGVLISLGHVGQIKLIEEIFGSFYIAQAVWEELNNYSNPDFSTEVVGELKEKVVKIKSKNHLKMVMDYGESESVILYEELRADYLLIDDHKARIVAESLDINCIGSIGLLIKAKESGRIENLRPIFKKWLFVGRYFSKKLINSILIEVEEKPLA